MSVVVMVWVCCHMPIYNCLRCSNSLYMYDMDVGCSLKGSTASMRVLWDHFHTVWKILQPQRQCSGIISTLTSSMFSASSPKSGKTSVVVSVWLCCPWSKGGYLYTPNELLQHLTMVMIPLQRILKVPELAYTRDKGIWYDRHGFSIYTAEHPIRAPHGARAYPWIFSKYFPSPYR